MKKNLFPQQTLPFEVDTVTFLEHSSRNWSRLIKQATGSQTEMLPSRKLVFPMRVFIRTLFPLLLILMASFRTSRILSSFVRSSLSPLPPYPMATVS